MDIFSLDAAKPFFDKISNSISVPEQWLKLFREVHSAKDPAALAEFPEVTMREESCRGREGHSIPLVIFQPAASSNKIFIYIHGGGFISGLGGRHLAWAKYMAAHGKMMVVCVEHRLAPEFPFPAALHDCIDVYRYYRESTQAEIIVGGDSSGGNLALAAGVCCLQNKIKLPDKLLALSAVTDMNFEKHTSMLQRGVDNPVISHMFLAVGAFQRACYAPNINDWNNPLISPICADLSHMSPVLIVAPEQDYCYDDNICFYKKMQQVGGMVTLHSYPGMPHSFFSYLTILPEQAEVANRRMIEFIG